MFKFDDHKCYQMPAHFGGHDYDPTGTVYRDMVSVNYTCTTDGRRLADYLPQGFELLRPELFISYAQCREVEWMAGSSYNLVEVGVPARFQGQRDRLEGQFTLVVWENKTAPILGGREQTGIPKVYADIQDLQKIQQNYFTNVGYEGNTFLRLEMLGAQPLAGSELAQRQTLAAAKNCFGWRYIPNVGGPGAALSQPILYPQSLEVSQAWAGTAVVEWLQLTWQQNPFYQHIVQALAELPIVALAPAIMLQGVATLKSMQARVLE